MRKNLRRKANRKQKEYEDKYKVKEKGTKAKQIKSPKKTKAKDYVVEN